MQLSIIQLKMPPRSLSSSKGSALPEPVEGSKVPAPAVPELVEGSKGPRSLSSSKGRRALRSLSLSKGSALPEPVEGSKGRTTVGEPVEPRLVSLSNHGW